ncbi:MAG: hypothetical protein ABI614_18915 [Planctomycetota bacterium]
MHKNTHTLEGNAFAIIQTTLDIILSLDELPINLGDDLPPTPRAALT